MMSRARARLVTHATLEQDVDWTFCEVWMMFWVKTDNFTVDFGANTI